MASFDQRRKSISDARLRRAELVGEALLRDFGITPIPSHEVRQNDGNAHAEWRQLRIFRDLAEPGQHLVAMPLLDRSSHRRAQGDCKRIGTEAVLMATAGRARVAKIISPRRAAQASKASRFSFRYA